MQILLDWPLDYFWQKGSFLTLFSTAFWNEKFTQGGLWGPPSKNGQEDTKDAENLYTSTPRDTMEGSKLILPKNPTEKNAGAPKIGPFSQKPSKMALFWPKNGP